MADEFGPAIAALERKLQEQHRGVLDTKRSINLLLKMAGKSAQYQEDEEASSSSVRPDQFYGKGLTTSAAEYLAARNQACQPDEILRALEAGGFDFDMLPWAKDDRLRSFAISLAKNTGGAGKFHKLKNGSFGLRSWYDEDFLKKAAAGAEATTKAKKKKSRKKAKTQAQAASVVKAQDKPHVVPKPKSSAKEKSRPAVEPAVQKETAS